MWKCTCACFLQPKRDFFHLSCIFPIDAKYCWKMEITELWVYPVKGCKGLAVQAASVTLTGKLERSHYSVAHVRLLPVGI
jgi:hypothetical protein